MVRLARLVIPGLPHHVTQRGNRRQQTFFCDEDYAAYVELMAEWCAERGVVVWAYCLMDESYLLAAARHVELNPVRAGLVADAAEWPWSSAGPHLSGRDDRLVKVAPLRSDPSHPVFVNIKLGTTEIRFVSPESPPNR